MACAGDPEPGRVESALPFELPTDAVVPSQEVGRLVGGLSVGPAGNAEYTLPLRVPRGRAGMEPQLALTYDSARGDGPLGLGFAVEGSTSAITRCVHDHDPTSNRVVRLDDGDRYCLDGEPLLLVQGTGAYGAPGSEYRTEVESITRVVASSTPPPAHGLTGFTVYREDGRILDYFATVSAERATYTDAFPTAPLIDGSPFSAWWLSTIRDRAGNEIQLTYDTTTGYDAATGEPFVRHRVDRIAYTHHATAPASREVRFEYEPRPDSVDESIAGVRHRFDYRLAALAMAAPGVDGDVWVVWRYELGYALTVSSPVAGVSRLASIALCDALGACLPATTFGWSGSSATTGPTYTGYAIGKGGARGTQLADMNGDGRHDLVLQHEDGHLEVLLLDRDASGPPWFVPGGDCASGAGCVRSSGAPIVADLDGDGRPELTLAERAACTSDGDCDAGEHCYRHEGQSNARGYCTPSCVCEPGTAYEYTPSSTVPAGGSRQCRSFETNDCSPSMATGGEGGVCGDFDDDGVSECVGGPQELGPGWTIVHYDPPAGGVAPSADAFTRGQALLGGALLPHHGQVAFGDLNGDGDLDLLRRDASLPTEYFYGRQTAEVFGPYEAVGCSAPPCEVVGPAIIDPRPGGELSELADAPQGSPAVVEILDFDGDGRTDLLIPTIRTVDTGEPETSSAEEGTPVPDRYLVVSFCHDESNDCGISDPADGYANTQHAEFEVLNLMPSYRDYLFLDVNGDGLADVVDLNNRTSWTPSALTQLQVAINTGNGLGPFQSALADADYQAFWPPEVLNASPDYPLGPGHDAYWHEADLRTRVLDYNRDGRDDFVMLGPNPRVYLATGLGSPSMFHAIALPFAIDDRVIAITNAAGEVLDRRRPAFLLGELNGDGQVDFVVGSHESTVLGFATAVDAQVLTLYLSDEGGAPRLHTVTDGLGLAQRVTYADLGDPSVYDASDDGGCTLGHRCADPRRTVVASILADNPGHPARETTYRYRGARYDSELGRFLGFHRIQTTDHESGERTEVTYRPDYTYRPPTAVMRGHYHPLAMRPTRSLTVIQTGDDVTVVRTDHRYGREPLDPATAETHPLHDAGGLERGYRLLLRDTLTREYGGTAALWDTMCATPPCWLSEQHTAWMSGTGEAARRSVRMTYDYEATYACDEEGCVEVGPRPAFPVPSAITRTVYHGDFYPLPDDIDWFNAAYDSSSQIEDLVRTVFDRRIDESSWLIGQPELVVTERCEDAGSPPFTWRRPSCPAFGTPPSVYVNTTQIEYAEDRPTRVVREPFAPALDPVTGAPNGLYRETTFTYVAGNVTKVDVASADGETRTHTVQWGPEQVFPESVSVLTGTRTLTRWTGWHPALGVPLIEQGFGGGQSQYRYDGFGRPRGARAPGGAWVDVDYAADPTAAMSVATSGPSVVDESIAYDSAGRVVRAATAAYLSASSWERGVVYDALGHVAEVQRPHPAGASAAAVELDHDARGRLTERRFRNEAGARTTVATWSDDWILDGSRWMRRQTAATPAGSLVTSFTDVENQRARTVERLAAFGSEPAADVTIETPREVRHLPSRQDRSSDAVPVESVSEVLQYDELGRPTWVMDSDHGEAFLRYNAFDEVVWLQDASGMETTLAYDGAGRLVRRDEGGEVTELQWDTALHGEGSLHFATAPDLSVVSYAYDEHGRRVAEMGPAGTVTWGYDTAGRLGSISYPGPSSSPLTVGYRYSSDGYLESIWDETGGVSEPLWRAEERHPDGRLARLRTGGDVAGGGAIEVRTYDAMTERLERLSVTSASGALFVELDHQYRSDGALLERSETVSGRSEQVTHDTLGRLRSWTRAVGGAPPQALSYEYDHRGNLLRVRDGSGAVTEELTYTGERGAGLTAPSTYNGQELVYDALGRQTIGSDGRSYTYGTRLTPTVARQGADELSIDYDAFGRRRMATHTQGGSVVRRVHYAAGLYERREVGGAVEHVALVYGPEGLVAQLRQDDGGAQVIREHVHRDELGNVVLVTDQDGLPTEGAPRWLSPFGRGVEADGSLSSPPLVSGAVSRGFAGREHDGAVGLENLGARLYDTALRRFVSPDPIARDTGSAQSWNRYAYGLNSPCNVSDALGLTPQPTPGYQLPRPDTPGGWDDHCSQCDFPEEKVVGRVPDDPALADAWGRLNDPGWLLNHGVRDPTGLEPASSASGMRNDGAPRRVSHLSARARERRVRQIRGQAALDALTDMPIAIFLEGQRFHPAGALAMFLYDRSQRDESAGDGELLEDLANAWTPTRFVMGAVATVQTVDTAMNGRPEEAAAAQGGLITMGATTVVLAAVGRGAGGGRGSGSTGAGPIRLRSFTGSLVEEVVASARRPRGAITEGARAISKKLGHAQARGLPSAFDGIAPTQANAEAIIRTTLENPARTVIGRGSVDVYNSSGRGVRFRASDNRFVGFLEQNRASR